VIVGAIVLFVLAVAVVGTTVLAAGGVLKINHVAGIRVHYFLVSQSSWEAGHLGALLPVTIGGVLAVAGGVACLLRPGSGGLLALSFVLFAALMAWGILRGDRAALDAIARDADDDGSE
jgi:hypothetical protein